MSSPGRRWGTALVAALVVAGLAGCTHDEAPTRTPAAPGSVALVAAVPENLSIGVVVSLTAAPGEGAEWRDAAEGALVAVRRFQLGGSQVTMRPVNDKGTAEGATAAVDALLAQGVAAIVVASSGAHLEAALSDAAQHGVPVLLPYADADAADLAPGTWLTGPDAATADARLVSALQQRKASRTFLVDAGGGPIPGLVPSGTRSFSAGTDPAALGKSLAQQAKKPDDAIDAVVVSGPAKLQATVVQGLQGAGVDVPYVLTPQALSPTFAADLSSAGGSLSADLVSAGLDNGDAGALESSPAGRSLAAYFSALRLAAADPAAKDFFGERPFSAVAGAADVRSHDAVVALVRAAAAAGSSEPAAVAGALPGLKLGGADGLAGPSLDFSAPAAVPADAVVALGATAQSPGLRPETGSARPALFWFELPGS